MSKRKSLTKKVRFGVFKRDGFVCQYCGDSPPNCVLEVDHITPVAAGGDDGTDNLITSCFSCNRGKGAEKLSTTPEAVAEKARVLKEKAEQLKAFERALSSKKAAITKKVNKIERLFMDEFEGCTFTDNFKKSARTFVEKLPYPHVEEAMEIACSKIVDPEDAVKYFCGICWTKIRERENG